MTLKIIISLALLLAQDVFAKNSGTDLEQQVAKVERAFAQTMADRDFKAFATFIDQDAIFLAGKQAAKGKAAVLTRWEKYFEAEAAPFSWRPETVVVLADGNLALSTGPVFNKQGKLTAFYTSTWRKQSNGVWKIIFDKGNKACPSVSAKTADSN